MGERFPDTAVLLPSHNKPEHLARSISSILNQTYRSFVIYLLDDNTDWTSSICRAFEREFMDRIFLIESDKELPPRNDIRVRISQVFNFLMEEAIRNGHTYITLATDDDFWFCDFLDVMVSGLKSHHAVYCNQVWCFLDENGIVTRSERREFSKVFDSSNLPDCVLDGGAVAFRSECLAELEPPWYPEDPSAHNHPDGMFLNRLALRYGIYPVGRTLMAHQRTRSSYLQKS